jgi:hypothetical protein
LSENILQTLMVSVDLTLISDKIVSPNLEGMHYRCKFQIMGGVILLMGIKLAGSICHYFPILHKDRP